MKRVDPLCVCAALAMFAGGHSHAASPGTETFTGGLNGWTNNVNATKWVATNQAARVTFASGLIPKNASLEAGPGATGGAFAGGYDSAGIEAIGFSFLAEDVQPSVLKIEITGGTNIFFQDLQPRMTAPGAWNHFLCSLVGPDAERWNGSPLTELPDALTNITRVAIRITTAGGTAQAYRLDDIFLDRLPLATALAPRETGTTVLWTNLRAGFTYRMQSAGSLTDSWTGVATLIATNTTAALSDTNSAPDSPRFYLLFTQ